MRFFYIINLLTGVKIRKKTLPTNRVGVDICLQVNSLLAPDDIRRLENNICSFFSDAFYCEEFLF